MPPSRGWSTRRRSLGTGWQMLQKRQRQSVRHKPPWQRSKLRLRRCLHSWNNCSSLWQRLRLRWCGGEAAALVEASDVLYADRTV